MPSHIQDLRPDSVPCKHPHWAAGQKSAPSVSLPGGADVSPVQSIHRLCPQGTFSALPSLCWSEPFTPRNGTSALPLQNKGEYESFPLRTNPNCIAMHFVTSVFLSTPEACSSPCSHLASKTLHPSPAALSWINHSRYPLVDTSHLTQGEHEALISISTSAPPPRQKFCIWEVHL